MATKPKRPRDTNQLAKLIVDISTGYSTELSKPVEPQKGRAGGLVGGKARAIILTPKRRREIAKKAAKARWKVEAGDD